MEKGSIFFLSLIIKALVTKAFIFCGLNQQKVEPNLGIIGTDLRFKAHLRQKGKGQNTGLTFPF